MSCIIFEHIIVFYTYYIYLIKLFIIVRQSSCYPLLEVVAVVVVENKYLIRSFSYL